MADQPPNTKLKMTLSFEGDTSHLSDPDMARIIRAINALLRFYERQMTGKRPRIKWVITKVEKDD